MNQRLFRLYLEEFVSNNFARLIIGNYVSICKIPINQSLGRFIISIIIITLINHDEGQNAKKIGIVKKRNGTVYAV